MLAINNKFLESLDDLQVANLGYIIEFLFKFHDTVLSIEDLRLLPISYNQNKPNKLDELVSFIINNACAPYLIKSQQTCLYQYKFDFL